eukprot:4171044-Pyramimonas_sp.AAC.1
MAKPSAEGGMPAARVDRAELLDRRGTTAADLGERSGYLEELAELRFTSRDLGHEEEWKAQRISTKEHSSRSPTLLHRSWTLHYCEATSM